MPPLEPNLRKDVKLEIAKQTLIDAGFELTITQGLWGTKKEIRRPVNHMSFSNDIIDAIQDLRNDDWEF